MRDVIQSLSQFIENCPTAYHTRDVSKNCLIENGFTPLIETEDWEIEEGGKYFVERGGSLIAFCVGKLDKFVFKTVAAHVDSPMLKLKENPEVRAENAVTLNVEKYGGGLWYSFMDRPLKIAGQIVVSNGERLQVKTVEAPFTVTIPSQALHLNREANESLCINPQIDLRPLFSLDENADFLKTAFADEAEIVSYDLFLSSAEKPYAFGKDDAFFAAPRIDNLVGVYAALQSILTKTDSNGICVAALFNHEEIGSKSPEGAFGDFLENTFKRLAYALRFDDGELYKALAASFLLSVDNAHAVHPNHPEKSDITNKTKLGGGIVIKSHAGGAYITDAISSALIKKTLEKANVPYQNFFNRSDAKSGSTLGNAVLSRFGSYGADIGIAQLSMHAACECIASADVQALIDGLKSFYQTDVNVDENGFFVQ